jgi:ClpP class serine protease
LERAGVKVTLVGAGKYKTDGNSFEPLSDSARAELQGRVDDFYRMFLQSVAASRGDTQANVRAGYGQGRCVTALGAVRAKLADRVGTLDAVLQEFGIRRGAAMAARKPRNARVVGDQTDAPDLAAINRARRQRQLDLMRASTPANCTGAPENYMEALQRRRRQLSLYGKSAEHTDIARRRREIELW